MVTLAHYELGMCRQKLYSSFCGGGGGGGGGGEQGEGEGDNLPYRVA